jgi:serine/threonine protein phosphatase PrpC
MDLGDMKIRAFAHTDVGRVRELNEDSHLVDGDAGFYAVADGMGGHAAGEIASAMAVTESRAVVASDQAALRAFESSDSGADRSNVEQLARRALEQAHRAICDRAARESDKHGMGTTLDCAVLTGGCAFIAHAGDSRVYLLRDGGAIQLTQDHSLIDGLLAAGYKVPNDLRRSPLRSVIVNALGVAPQLHVDEVHVELAEGDRLLLCSDGLYEHFEDEEELAAVVEATPAEEAAARLVNLACDRGGYDNATVILLYVDELEAAATVRAEAHRGALVEQLRRSELLAGFSEDECRRLLRIAAERRIAAESVLPRLSTSDATFYFVLQGGIAAGQGAQVHRPGDAVYVDNLTRDGATATPPSSAVEASRVLAIRKSDLTVYRKKEPELVHKLLESALRLAPP